MNKKVMSSPEVRERAVRMVLTSEHEHASRWATLVSVSSKIGCTPKTLRAWVNKMEVDPSYLVLVSNSSTPGFLFSVLFGFDT